MHSMILSIVLIYKQFEQQCAICSEQLEDTILSTMAPFVKKILLMVCKLFHVSSG